MWGRGTARVCVEETAGRPSEGGWSRRPKTGETLSTPSQPTAMWRSKRCGCRRMFAAPTVTATIRCTMRTSPFSLQEASGDGVEAAGPEREGSGPWQKGSGPWLRR